MRMDAAFTPLFAYPITDILAQLPGEADPLWDLSKLRQERHRTHRATRSIIFNWLEQLTPQSPQPVMTASHLPGPLFAAVAQCAAALESHFGGTVVRLLLAELPAGGTIPAHNDSGSLLSQTHRCHLAIETNPAVRFTVGDETFHMEEGMTYEMDNMRVHAVENAGPTRRVHLICNILPPQGAEVEAYSRG